MSNQYWNNVFQLYPDEVDPVDAVSEARPEDDSEIESEYESESECEVESESESESVERSIPLPGHRFINGKWEILPYNQWNILDKELARELFVEEESDDEEEVVEREWQEVLEERWFQLVKNTKPVYGCPIADRIAKIMQDKKKGKYVDDKMIELINEQNAITSE